MMLAMLDEYLNFVFVIYSKLYVLLQHGMHFRSFSCYSLLDNAACNKAKLQINFQTNIFQTNIQVSQIYLENEKMMNTKPITQTSGTIVWWQQWPLS